jgi:hypothetical protein|tara:strand:+ start:235 stop:543 length:309 start_codon:yes stop_codon:yes gene_type:complete
MKKPYKRNVDKIVSILKQLRYDNRVANAIVKPFKLKLIDLLGGQEKLTVDGSIGSLSIQKISKPMVDMDLLKANPIHYKKYIKYQTQYRLTSKEFDIIMEVA